VQSDDEKKCERREADGQAVQCATGGVPAPPERGAVFGTKPADPWAASSDAIVAVDRSIFVARMTCRNAAASMGRSGLGS